MPEIAEVARIVHFLRTRLVGHKLATVSAQDDNKIFDTVGTTAAEFQSSLTGKKVVGAGQQGKYFWIEMESPPHPLIHFGMTGWLHLRDAHTYYHPPSTEMDATDPPAWPPKFTKFSFTTDSSPVVEGAFTDPRRFSRVRLLDCKTVDIRNVTPLKENGPDPVIDKAILTKDWLGERLAKRHVPIKALLLDQAMISGVGNWVGDEILYHAAIHPEQYGDTLSAAQVTTLHKSLMHITQTAVDLLAASDKFPEEWLFKHRWNKGKKGDDAGKMPGGERIVWLTVGGRTSAVVPSRQKKTGALAQNVKVKPDMEDVGEEKPQPKGKKRKSEPVEEKPVIKKGKADGKVKEEQQGKDEPMKDAVKLNGAAANTKVKRAKAVVSDTVNTKGSEDGRRRSGRVTR